MGHLQERVDVGAYNPPKPPPRNAKPFASARYFRGKTSDGMACTIEIVERVHPTRTPPPISTDILLALADTTAPTKEMTEGIMARYFLSSTSERRPTIGDKTLCMRSGPYHANQYLDHGLKGSKGNTWMTQPAISASPRSLMMNPITDPAATTTNT
jgi:hypothetical protein